MNSIELFVGAGGLAKGPGVALGLHAVKNVGVPGT